MDEETGLRSEAENKGFDLRNTNAASSEVSPTYKELQILSLLSSGFTLYEIGKLHDLSEHTIRCYLKRVLSKLKCDDVPSAISKAIRTKLID